MVWTKEQQDDSRRKWRENNPDYVNKKRLERRRFVNSLKVGKPCVDCGICYPPYVMDFDHRDPKDKHMGIAQLVHRRCSIANILKEIAKCDLVCANCHRERTYGSRYNSG